jgi:hypothetical protein
VISLVKPPKDYVIYNNVRYSFKPYYNRVLVLIFEVLPDKFLSDAEKIEISIRALSNDAPVNVGIFELLMHELFPRTKRQGNTDERYFDFEQDADIIYSAFMQTYGIDLLKERNSLDWRVFNALLQGLPEGTEFSRIVKLRATKLPKRTKENAAYVDSLAAAKRAVALKRPEGERKQRLAEAWKNIARGLANVRR